MAKAARADAADAADRAAKVADADLDRAAKALLTSLGQTDDPVELSKIASALASIRGEQYRIAAAELKRKPKGTEPLASLSDGELEERRLRLVKELGK